MTYGKRGFDVGGKGKYGKGKGYGFKGYDYGYKGTQFKGGMGYGYDTWSKGRPQTQYLSEDPHAPPEKQQWWGCTTILPTGVHCKGKWTAGWNPPSVCRFCNKPCKFTREIDPPYEQYKGQPGQKGQNKGKGKGKGESAAEEPNSEYDKNAATTLLNQFLAKGQKEMAETIASATGVAMPQPPKLVEESPTELLTKKKAVLAKLTKDKEKAAKQGDFFMKKLEQTVGHMKELDSQIEVAGKECKELEQKVIEEFHDHEYCMPRNHKTAIEYSVQNTMMNLNQIFKTEDNQLRPHDADSLKDIYEKSMSCLQQMLENIQGAYDDGFHLDTEESFGDDGKDDDTVLPNPDVADKNIDMEDQVLPIGQVKRSAPSTVELAEAMSKINNDFHFAKGQLAATGASSSSGAAATVKSN